MGKTFRFASRSQIISISPDGFVSFPGLEMGPAKGLTLHEFYDAHDGVHIVVKQDGYSRWGDRLGHRIYVPANFMEFIVVEQTMGGASDLEFEVRPTSEFAIRSSSKPRWMAKRLRERFG